MSNTKPLLFVNNNVSRQAVGAMKKAGYIVAKIENFDDVKLPPTSSDSLFEAEDLISISLSLARDEQYGRPASQFRELLSKKVMLNFEALQKELQEPPNE